VFVPHPIQDRTDNELRALAGAACAEIVKALTTDRMDEPRSALGATLTA
jgi:hypothetical protein